MSSWCPQDSTLYVWDGCNWYVFNRNLGRLDPLESEVSKLGTSINSPAIG